LDNSGYVEPRKLFFFNLQHLLFISLDLTSGAAALLAPSPSQAPVLTHNYANHCPTGVRFRSRNTI
jgi:hypothetical protein